MTARQRQKRGVGALIVGVMAFVVFGCRQEKEPYTPPASAIPPKPHSSRSADKPLPGGTGKETIATFGEPQLSKTLYIVPVGVGPTLVVNALKAHYQQTLHLNTKTLPSLKLEKKAMDTERHQLIAEEVIAQMEHNYAKLAEDPNNYFLAITHTDMYTLKRNWRYAFGSLAGHFAVVSDARMDPSAYGQGPEPKLRQKRLQKMALKYIAEMIFERYESDNPKSVLYGRIKGPDGLDARDETL